MVKVDKSQYTKEEWRRIKQQRRLEKEVKNVATSVPTSSEYNILCLKHGTKYSSEYVNRLYNMVTRNCTLNPTFFCITDDPTGLNSDIITIPTPKGLEGWWCKPYIFSADLPIKGTVLYLDLDVVIANNIDKLFKYQPNNWCTIRDFTRKQRPNWQKYNSSVIKFKAGELDFVWQNFNRDPDTIQRKFFGDQDYLYDITHTKLPATLYPDNWILSWKWEVRKSKEFAPGGRKGARKLRHIENVVPIEECCVCVFHGDPNPEICEDPWVIDNWK